MFFLFLFIIILFISFRFFFIFILRPRCEVVGMTWTRLPILLILVMLVSGRGQFSMYDTVAAFVEPPQPLGESLFQGGSFTYYSHSIGVLSRFWHNPTESSGYEPRVTYWRQAQSDELSERGLDDLPSTSIPDNGLLKVEFSIPHMYAKLHAQPSVLLTNIDHNQSVSVLRDVDGWLRDHFGQLPSLVGWTAQRIDYAWNWDVESKLVAYMGVVSKLRLKTMSRHPFDASEGVVWKSKSTKGRWVKFYNKKKQLGLNEPDAGVLRFEISNYKSSVAYMCKQWFKCDRVVSEVVHPGRALYTMAWVWDSLGLGSGGYGRDDLELAELLRVFGVRRLPTARLVLDVYREYGTDSFKPQLGYVSKSTYYRYCRELKRAGLLTLSPERALKPLELPVVCALSGLSLPQNLGNANVVPTTRAGEASISSDVWKNFSEKIGVPGGVQNLYLSEWLSEHPQYAAGL